MGLQTYEQRAKKIHWNTENEFIKQFNRLHVVGNMDVTIKDCVPDYTTTGRCSLVNYWIYIN